MTRGRIFEMVAERAGRRVRMMRLPVWLAAVNAALLRVVHPRMGQFARFAVGLARHDAIENVALTVSLLGGVRAPWPLVAWACASLKFALLALGLLYAVSGAVARAAMAPSRWAVV